jgi:hypothetical protein
LEFARNRVAERAGERKINWILVEQKETPVIKDKDVKK